MKNGWPKEALCARGCGRPATARIPLKGGGFSLDRGVYGTWIQVCEDYYKGRRGCVSRPRYWLHRLVQWLLALSLVGCGGPPFEVGSQQLYDVRPDAQAADGAPAADQDAMGEGSAPEDGGSAQDGRADAGEAQVEACAPATHSDGIGQSWQDCVPLGIYNQVQASKACEANGSPCVANTCLSDAGAEAICNRDPALPGYCSCWTFAGPNAGHVLSRPCTTPAQANCGGGVTWN